MCTWNIQTILQDLVLAIVINTSATLLSGAPLAWTTWYPFTCAALGTNIIAQLVIPTSLIAKTLIQFLDDRPYKVFIQIFIENLIFVTIISLTMAYTQVGRDLMLDAWSQTYLWLVLIGYITSIALFLIFSHGNNINAGKKLT